MHFDVRTATEGGFLVVVVVGELDLGHVPDVRAAVQRLLGGRPAGDPVRVVVDLEAVDLIDSAGLGALLGVLRRARQADAAAVVRLAGAQGAVARTLDLVGLDAVLPRFPTVAAAVAEPVGVGVGEVDRG